MYCQTEASFYHGNSASLLAVLMENIPIGLIIVRVSEAQTALLCDACCFAEGHNIRMPPAG